MTPRASMVRPAPDEEPSPEQVIQCLTGQVRLGREGVNIGFALPPELRPDFLDAVARGFLLQPAKPAARLADAFLWWCEARCIPAVFLDAEPDAVDMAENGNAAEPLVRLRVAMETSGRMFSKAGSIAVADLLLDHVFDLRLAPWQVAAGAMPISLARDLAAKILPLSYVFEPTSGRRWRFPGAAVGGDTLTRGFAVSDMYPCNIRYWKTESPS